MKIRVLETLVTGSQHDRQTISPGDLFDCEDEALANELIAKGKAAPVVAAGGPALPEASAEVAQVPAPKKARKAKG